MNYIWWSVSSALFFALTFLLRKLAVKSLSINIALLIEVIVEIILLAVAFFIFPMPTRGNLVKNPGVVYAALAGLMVTLGVGANMLALKSSLLSRVIVIASPSQVIFGVLLGIILFGESLTALQIIGSILAIVGIILMVV